MTAASTGLGADPARDRLGPRLRRGCGASRAGSRPPARIRARGARGRGAAGAPEAALRRQLLRRARLVSGARSGVDRREREGLPFPIPVTLRFPGIAEADETRLAGSGRSVPVEDGCGWSPGGAERRGALVATVSCAATGCCGRSTRTSTSRSLELARGGSVLTGLAGTSSWRAHTGTDSPQGARRTLRPEGPATCAESSSLWLREGSGLRPCGVAVRSVSNG